MSRRLSVWFALGFAVASSAGLHADEPKADTFDRARLVPQLGHASPVSAAALSPDGALLFTGSSDATGRLWDVKSGILLRTFAGRLDRILAAAYSPQGRYLLTGSTNLQARMWDDQTGREVLVFSGHTESVNAVAFSPDGRQVLTGSKDNTARLWDAKTAKELVAFRGHADTVNSVAFSPDGRQVLTGSVDKTARLWDAKTGKELREIRGHTDHVTSVAFSPDGKLILTGSADKTALLWDAKTGVVVRVVRGLPDGVSSVAFAADGKRLLVGHGSGVRMVEAQTGAELRKFPEYPGKVLSVAFAPGGRAVLACSLRAVRLSDADTGANLREFHDQAQVVGNVAFSPNGRHLLMSSRAQTHLWDAQPGQEIRAVRGHEAVFSPDGKLLLTAIRNTVHVWDVRTGTERLAFAGHTEQVDCMAYSPDGKFVLTGSRDKTARLWDAQTGKELRAFRGHTAAVTCVTFISRGRRVATGGGDGTVRIWSADDGAELRSLAGHTEPVNSIAFSPRGHQLLSGGVDRTVRLWDLRTGKEIRQFPGDTKGVLAVAFSPDGTQVVAGCRDSSARLWETETGKEVRALAGHVNRVTAVSFSPNGKFLLTGSTDKTAVLWDARTGRELCKLLSFRDGTWAVVDPDGRFDASKGGDVDDLHWVVRHQPIALDQLKERYYDPGLLAKILGFHAEPLRKVAPINVVKLFPLARVTEIKPTDRTLSIELTNEGGGIGRVQVFVNGKELLADARGPKPDVDAKQSKLVVDLAGAPIMPGKPNRVEVVTWNAEGYLSSRGLTREWTPAGAADPSPPELYVIVCGVSTFAEAKLNLRYAAKDATDMAEALRVAGNRLFGADKVHVTLLATGTDPKLAKPTKDNIRKAFEGVRKAKPTDLLVVYLAGHGVSLKQGSDEYCYLTTDARSTDPKDLADPAVRAASMVTSSELVEWIKRIPALKQVMVLDTCAAGAAAAKLLEHRDLSGDQVRALDRLKDRTGFHVLMGCAADRVSYEASQYSQGLLTYSLLKGMAGAKLRVGEYLDVSGLFQYSADEVPQLALGIGGIQKPLVIAPRGTSFDIGRLLEADRRGLPLSKPKPVALRPLISNAADGDDDLKLSARIGARLADGDSLAPPGTPADVVYVDADDLPGGVRPAGNYTVVGKAVTVRLILKSDGRTVGTATIEGTTDDLPGLAAKVAEAIRRGAK